MLIHDASSIIVGNGSAAGKASFFNGSLNTLELDFDPLITGYAFFKWVTLPTWVVSAYPNFAQMTEKNFNSFGGISDIELESSNIAHGFNANEFNFATGIKKNNTDFNIKHNEFSGSPIRNMYQYWITGIRDPETGIATYPKTYGIDYSTKNHTGELVYIVTRPDANNVDSENVNNIEFACYYSAVFPTKIILGHFNHDIGSHDKVEYDQSFKGNFHMSAKVDAFAKEVLASKTYGILELAEFDPVKPDNSHQNLTDSIFEDLKGKQDAISGYDYNHTRPNVTSASNVSAANPEG